MKSPANPCFSPAPPRAGLALLALLSLLLTGCSSFSRQWNEAGGNPTPSDSIAGRWEGRWSSDVNGHNGKLRCLVTRKDDSHCTARFRATYAKIFHFNYTAMLEIQPHFGGWEFNGEADLGKLAGGVYSYEGRASATNFYSTYRSKYDHGIFEMKRPK